MIDLQRSLVQLGWHPAVAGAAVRRAAERVLRSWRTLERGLGKIHQTRSLRRDLDPTLKPRPILAGEQCVRLQEIPGNETVLYQQLDSYRSRGWNVMEIEPTKGFPSVRVFWACPPGRVPQESQTQILQSEPWGAPLYAGTPIG